MMAPYPRHCEPKAKQPRASRSEAGRAGSGLLRRCDPRQDGERVHKVAVQGIRSASAHVAGSTRQKGRPSRSWKSGSALARVKITIRTKRRLQPSSKKDKKLAIDNRVGR